MKDKNKLVQKSISVIKKYSKKNPAVSVSGGKDSLVVLDLGLQAGVENFVFSNTTIEFEETVDYVKELEKFYGINIEILEPPRGFFDLVEKFGWPSRRWRWCCEVTKFGPLGKYALENKITAYITGLRKEESARRTNYKGKSQNPLIPVVQVNPILDWSIMDVWDYIGERSLPINPLYRRGFKRVGCWCCPQKTKCDWEATENHSPESMEFMKSSIKESLTQYQGIGIDNVDNFVEEMAWTKHVNLQVSEICGSVERDGDIFLLTLEKDQDVEKVLKILPIISDKFVVKGKTILIEGGNKRKLKILIEKALNCEGCGACIPTCKNLALQLEDSQIKVDETRCKRCLKCTKTKFLRGACIARNYGLFRKEIRIYNNQGEINGDSSLSNGIVRTRIPIDQLKDKSSILGREISNDGAFTVKSKKFEATFTKTRGFSEIEISSSKSDLFENLLSVRKFILEASS